MSEQPVFPPLMSGQMVDGADDPLLVAAQKATLGCDAGLVVYSITANRLAGALVFAPEVPLSAAMTMLPLCGVGFQNALGALAPPEVAVHLEWSGGIRINGASCGRLRTIASTDDPEEVPDWLVVGFELPLMLLTDVPGDAPDQTALFEEGCADVSPKELLEAWARHSLAWINRWEEEGPRPLHGEWRGLAHGIGEPIQRSSLSGSFLGVDETFGMLIRDGKTTHLVPLTDVLETGS